MAKYDPLRRYLSRQKTDAVILSFTEIERLIAGILPKAATHPDWWSCLAEDHPRHVQKLAWRAAGYTATLVVGEDKTRFDRVAMR